MFRMVQKKMENCSPLELDGILDTMETDTAKSWHWEDVVDHSSPQVSGRQTKRSQPDKRKTGRERNRKKPRRLRKS